MKTAIKTLLAAFGVAPAAHVSRLEAGVRRAEDKAAQMEERLVRLHGEADGWKRRYEGAADAAAAWKLAARRGTADAAKAKADVERAQAETERYRARLQDFREALDRVRSRLEAARRGIDLSNEQLMAMEVKLDLIEAAIQVLDLRTRERAVSDASVVRADA